MFERYAEGHERKGVKQMSINSFVGELVGRCPHDLETLPLAAFGEYCDAQA